MMIISQKPASFVVLQKNAKKFDEAIKQNIIQQQKMEKIDFSSLKKVWENTSEAAL